jgi:hypothetical protein
MQRTGIGDAGAQLLLTEARRRLEAARAGSHRVGRSEEAVGQPRDAPVGGPVDARRTLVRRLWSTLYHPRRICVE